MAYEVLQLVLDDNHFSPSDTITVISGTATSLAMMFIFNSALRVLNKQKTLDTGVQK